MNPPYNNGLNGPYITKRLANDTNKQDNSYQSSLTKEQIIKKLDGYTRVESNKLHKVPLNTHIRYFVVNPKTNDKQFRLGGFLTKFGDNNEYIVLSNGKFSWSVQLANTIFYKKMSKDEMKEQIATEVEDDIRVKMEKLMKENKKLKDTIKEIKETTIKNKKK